MLDEGASRQETEMIRKKMDKVKLEEAQLRRQIDSLRRDIHEHSEALPEYRLRLLADKDWTGDRSMRAWLVNLGLFVDRTWNDYVVLDTIGEKATVFVVNLKGDDKRKRVLKRLVYVATS